jgi:hypothetical protein
VIVVDNTDEVHRLSTGKRFTITNADGSITYLQVNDGIITVGGNIQFPATQNTNPDPNTLDDYEEGTWPAAVSVGGGSAVLDANYATGWYVKVGKGVIFGGNFRVDGASSPLGVLNITGLPFVAVSGNSSRAPVALYFEGLNAGVDCLIGYVNAGASSISVWGYTNTSGSIVNGAPLIKAGSYISVHGAYIIS